MAARACCRGAAAQQAAWYGRAISLPTPPHAYPNPCRYVNDNYWTCQYPDVPVVQKLDPKWPAACTGVKVRRAGASAGCAVHRCCWRCPADATLLMLSSTNPTNQPLSQADWWMQCGGTTSPAKADKADPGTCCPVNAKCAAKSKEFWWCTPLDYVEQVVVEEAPRPSPAASPSPSPRPAVIAPAGTPPAEPNAPPLPFNPPEVPVGTPNRPPRAPLAPRAPRTPSAPRPNSPPNSPYTAPWPGLPPLPPRPPLLPPSPPAAPNRPWDAPLLPPAPPPPYAPPVEVKLSYEVKLSASCEDVNVASLVDKMTDTIYDRLASTRAIITTTHYCEDLVASATSAPSATRVSVSSSGSTRNLLQAVSTDFAQVRVENTVVFPQDPTNTAAPSLSPASAAQVLEAVADQMNLVVDKAVAEQAKEQNLPSLTATVTEATVTLQCQVGSRSPQQARPRWCTEG
jgi:hypothetical protein